jgi:hypothetical protein
MNAARPRDDVLSTYQPFLEAMVSGYRTKLDSVHLFGSAIGPDYDHERSDINSVVVLHQMDLGVLEGLAPLGKIYGQQGIAAPFIMTPEFVAHSLDTFPLEFLNLQLFHVTVFGKDLFKGLTVRRADLRYQCEWELKVRMIGLRQRYLSCAGDSRQLADSFADTFSGYIPLFRGLIHLYDRQPPQSAEAVIATLSECSGINLDVFVRVAQHKKQRQEVTGAQLNQIFKDYYSVLETLAETMDAIGA